MTRLRRWVLTWSRPAANLPGMTTAQIHVRRAEAADTEALTTALADAFRDDPVVSWLIPADASHREDRLRAFFGSMARSYLRRDKHVLIAGDGAGAALWAQPGSWVLPPAEIARESPAAVKAFGRHLPRALRLLNQIEGLHPKEPHHWYLAYVGTRCDSQGQGIGSSLLREVLDQADAQRVPAYLESSNERNLSLYERHGFKVVEEIKALGDGPSLYRMWRDVAAG
jgi:ribosomal protein S18 acetylase RimI-like enzyme